MTIGFSLVDKWEWFKEKCRRANEKNANISAFRKFAYFFFATHSVYKGKRIKRGLFKASTGKTINADVNGALNILKKHLSQVAWNDQLWSNLVEACSTPSIETWISSFN